MEFDLPEAIELTVDEEKLYAQLPASAAEVKDHKEWQRLAQIMGELSDSLWARKVIPEIRWKIFSDSAYAEPRAKPMKEHLEARGEVGNQMFRSPHFLEYLHYFVNGPDLPETTIHRLYEIICLEMDLRENSRKFIRVYGKNLSQGEKNHAAKQFFRLAFEFGMSMHEARLMREDAKAQ